MRESVVKISKRDLLTCLEGRSAICTPPSGVLEIILEAKLEPLYELVGLS